MFFYIYILDWILRHSSNSRKIMSNLDDDTPKQHAGNFPPTVQTAPPNADMENKSLGTTPTGPGPHR